MKRLEWLSFLILFLLIPILPVSAHIVAQSDIGSPMVSVSPSPRKHSPSCLQPERLQPKPLLTNDPKSILNTDVTTVNAKSVTNPDPSALLGMGPKDIMIMLENPDGSVVFQSYFQEDCYLQAQPNPGSPTGIIDAKITELDGDGIPDLVVLEESGPKLFVNDTTGTMVSDLSIVKADSKAIETLDVNNDGLTDLLIATNQGVTVQLADDYLMYSDFQTLPSGNTVDMVLYDFDQDGDADMVTVDTMGVVRFYQNDKANGFTEIGTPVQVHGSGTLIVLDMTGDGQMDVLVEIEPGVHEVVDVTEPFGGLTPLTSGQREIRFVLFDHLGTAKMLIGNLGNVVWPRPNGQPNKLLPFGKDMDFNPASPNPVEAAYKLTFTNKEIDHQTDLHYFGARYYHATLPRFISPDPVSGKMEIPTSWNRYLYCRNDPVNMIDPDGKKEIYILYGAAGIQKLLLIPGTSNLRNKAIEMAGKTNVEINFNAKHSDIKTAQQDPEAKAVYIFSHGGQGSPGVGLFESSNDPYKDSDIKNASESIDIMGLHWCNSGVGDTFETYAALAELDIEFENWEGEVTVEEILDYIDACTIPTLENYYADYYDQAE